ncbi:2-hydroxyacid dehydrogenase [Stakelama pacifica]|nr:D-glycerate dehydrogenase [Stakelama pacifica]GGO97841.1 D-glycerate dehydrogenase [Stakelama pacifica]
MTDRQRTAHPRVLVTRRLPDPIEARMRELFDMVGNPDDLPMDADALARAAADCDVLVPTVTDRIDADVIAAGKGRLALIANYGAGFNHIDMAAAKAAGIVVTNTPGVLTDDTADLAMALILAVPRRMTEGERMLRAGEWSGWRPTGMLGRRIGGRKLGIVGMGRIGQAVAARARAFGLSIHYHSRHRVPDVLEAQLGAVWHADLDAMLAAVDIVSIHTPHTSDTEMLIDARRIALLGNHAFVINTSRGAIIDQDALIEALEQGRIAGAGLDVYTNEPAVDPRLIALPNVVLTPHLGSATVEAREGMGAKVITNIRVWADGHRPPDQVLEGWR